MHNAFEVQGVSEFVLFGVIFKSSRFLNVRQHTDRREQKVPRVLSGIFDFCKVLASGHFHKNLKGANAIELTKSPFCSVLEAKICKLRSSKKI